MQLQIAQTTATAYSGTQLNFPRITVSNVGAYAARMPVIVQVILPPFTSFGSVSGGSFLCSGTFRLNCEILSLQAGESRSIDITLITSGTGTFTSNVTVLSGNDSTASNNSGAVQLSVTPLPTTVGGGSSSGGAGSSGGGGGGRFEWLALAFLGLLAARRILVASGNRFMNSSVG